MQNQSNNHRIFFKQLLKVYRKDAKAQKDYLAPLVLFVSKEKNYRVD